MSVNPSFEKWGKGFSGCDGGNLQGSVWFCGIEWGSGTDHVLKNEIERDVSDAPQVYQRGEDLLRDPKTRKSHPLGIKLAKLITSMRGCSTSDYRRIINEDPFPFHRDSDYFKLNLFPVACRRTRDPWTEEQKTATGFATKQECLEWCRKYRFPQMRKWLEQGKPRSVICYGSRYKDDFKESFGVTRSPEKLEYIDGKNLVWIREDVTNLVIIPFLGQGGLLSDRSLQAFGERLGQMLDGKARTVSVSMRNVVSVAPRPKISAPESRRTNSTSSRGNLTKASAGTTRYMVRFSRTKGSKTERAQHAWRAPTKANAMARVRRHYEKQGFRCSALSASEIPGSYKR